MDEERVRSSLRRVADGAPQPSDLRDTVQRRAVNRRRRVVGLSVAAALIVGFSSAVAIDAVDDDAGIEVVPATEGESPVSSRQSTTVATVTDPSVTDTSVVVISSTPPPQLEGTTASNSTESWIVATQRSYLACPMPYPAPPCVRTGKSDTLQLLPPGANQSITLPRSNFGEISWVVVDALRERIFFGVTSGCDPGDNGTWMIGFDGVTRRQLNHVGSRPAISPDGRFLAQTAHTDGCGSRQLVVQEIESDRRFTYISDQSLWNVSWVDDGAALLVGTEELVPQVLRFPISSTGAIADPEFVDELLAYRILDASGNRSLLAWECPPTANCVRPILGYAIASNGVIESEIPCPGGDCDRPGEPRLGPNGTDIMWVSSEPGPWGVDRLEDQEIRPHTSDDGFVLLTKSGVADW